MLKIVDVIYDYIEQFKNNDLERVDIIIKEKNND